MSLDTAAERKILCEWQPHLERVSFDVKSPSDRRYNCVAFAAGDTTRIWSPAVGVGGKLLGGYHWPPGAFPQFPTVRAVEEMFEARGFVRTALTDVALEVGVTKLALFGHGGMGEVTHAARQCASGRWASKMGDCCDIEHDLHDVQGGIFGMLRSVLRKDPPKPPAAVLPTIIVVPRRRSR